MSLFSFFTFDDKTDMKIKIAANLSFLACFGAAGWIASLMNFGAEKLGLKALDFGLILTVNETAVIFGFIISFLLSYISESRLLGILIAMAGTGILLSAFAGTENPIFGALYSMFGSGISSFAVNLAIFAFILSLSIEYFEKTRDSLVKHSTDSSATSLIMSKISAYCLLGTAAGYLVVTIIGFIPMNIALADGSSSDISYYVLYPLIGLPLIVIGIMSSKKATSAKALKENVELIVRGKFFNFYILTFCTAAVNIIMIFFGAFFLVDKFKLSLGFIGLIFLLHSGLIFFLKGKATEIMKNKGEDLTMKIRYIVTLVFFAVLLLCEAPFVDENSFMKYVLLAILALYGLTTLFDNSIKSFISYFASPNEQRSNMMIYTKLIQIAKIIIPLAAGLLSLTLGFYGVFGLGVILAGVCLFISYKIYAAYQDTNDGKPLEEG
jgi:hypothetical protein